MEFLYNTKRNELINLENKQNQNQNQNQNNIKIRFMGNTILFDYENKQIQYSYDRTEELTEETIDNIDKIFESFVIAAGYDPESHDLDERIEKSLLRGILIELHFNGYLYHSSTPLTDAIAEYSTRKVNEAGYKKLVADFTSLLGHHYRAKHMDVSVLCIADEDKAYFIDECRKVIKQLEAKDLNQVQELM